MNTYTKVEEFVYCDFLDHQYARFVLAHMILKPELVKDFAPHMAEFQLWCTHKGERKQVTGVEDSFLLFGDERGHFSEVSEWGPNATTIDLTKAQKKDMHNVESNPR